MIDFEKERILDGKSISEVISILLKNSHDPTWVEAVISHLEERERIIKRSMFRGRYKNAIEELARQKMGG